MLLFGAVVAPGGALLELPHDGFERLACLAFSVGSLPFQFTPALVAVVEKIKERLKIAEVRDRVAQRPSIGMADFSVEQAD